MVNYLIKTITKPFKQTYFTTQQNGDLKMKFLKNLTDSKTDIYSTKKQQKD